MHRIIDEVKAELKLPQIKVNYVPVNIQNRQALVANGTVQLECGGTVNTFARNKQVDFSPVSYVAASQLLVLKASRIAEFEDLNGKVVAVATGGSSEPELKHIIETNKLNVRVLTSTTTRPASSPSRAGAPTPTSTTTRPSSA